MRLMSDKRVNVVRACIACSRQIYTRENGGGSSNSLSRILKRVLFKNTAKYLLFLCVYVYKYTLYVYMHVCVCVCIVPEIVCFRRPTVSSQDNKKEKGHGQHTVTKQSSSKIACKRKNSDKPKLQRQPRNRDELKE